MENDDAEREQPNLYTKPESAPPDDDDDGGGGDPANGSWESGGG